MRADPIGLQGEINLYGYVLNDPVNFIDPYGLDRYNPCSNLTGSALWACKKYVDWGCSGTKNIVCCESEKQECNLDIDWCKADAEEKANKCNLDYLQCISKTKKK